MYSLYSSTNWSYLEELSVETGGSILFMNSEDIHQRVVL